MTIQLLRQSYGKHRVRVSKIKRPRLDSPKNEKHELIEASVDVELEGDFADSYTHQDNSQVVATDTCRNTVYVLAKEDPFDTIESFGVRVAEHFIATYPHVRQATIRLTEHRWHRMLESPYAFIGSDQETPTATIVTIRNSKTQVESGIANLMIAKTTESGFSNFHRDAFCTLPDTEDRILATVLKADWSFTTQPDDFEEARKAIRKAMLETFVVHFSPSVQDTLYRMAVAALNSVNSIDKISLAMPNKHHLRFDLKPFDRVNDNEVFVVTDEPFGYISATVGRTEI